MLIFRKICGNLMLANTAQSFAGTDFFLCRPLIALIGLITFFLKIWYDLLTSASYAGKAKEKKVLEGNMYMIRLPDLK